MSNLFEHCRAGVSSAKPKYGKSKAEANYEGENETYIEASVENSGSILYDK